VTASAHQVHETAWVLVVRGEAEVAAADGDRLRGGSGLLIQFDPGERHRRGRALGLAIRDLWHDLSVPVAGAPTSPPLPSPRPYSQGRNRFPTLGVRGRAWPSAPCSPGTAPEEFLVPPCYPICLPAVSKRVLTVAVCGGDCVGYCQYTSQLAGTPVMT
jgi:hypothetical protein